jgi:hypothetical protein
LGVRLMRDLTQRTAVRLSRLAWNSAAIGVGLIVAWYWMLNNISWTFPPVLSFSLLLDFATGVYIPVLSWAILRPYGLRAIGLTTAAIITLHLYSQTAFGRAIWKAFGPG